MESRKHLWRVFPALMISLILHGLVMATWPHLRKISAMPVMVEGELIAPAIRQPPSALPPLPEMRPATNVPPPIRQTPEQLSVPRPDNGVALPLIAEPADTTEVKENDFEVQSVPPVQSGTALPLGSKPGETSLEQYRPSVMSTGEAGAEDQVDQEILSGFGNDLRVMATQFGRYPEFARQRGWQGRVRIIVRYDRNGKTYQVSVNDSSGYKVLDEQAQRMVKQASDVAPLPDTLINKAFSVIVPVNFMMK